MAIGRVRTIFSGPAGTPWLGTAYFDAPVDFVAQDWVNATGAFWGAIDARMDDSVSWTTEAEVLIIDEVTGVPQNVVSTNPVAGAGSSVGERAPTLLQALLRFRTGSFVDGREVRGRWFIPGLSESQLSDGVLDPTAVVLFNATALTFITTAGISPVIWQRPRIADPEAVPPVTARAGSKHPILAGSVTNRFSPLRSRRD